MSHITLPCIVSIKIDVSLDSGSKYHEDQEKKGLHFLRENIQNGEMFSDMRKPILSFVFRKKYCIYLCKYKQKQPDIALKLVLIFFWPIDFSVLIKLGWFPYC